MSGVSSAVSMRISGILRRLVGIGDAGELLDDAGAGLGVEALAVAALADLERGRDVDLEEAAGGLDHVAHLGAGRGVGGDRRADGDAAVLGDLATRRSRCAGC